MFIAELRIKIMNQRQVKDVTVDAYLRSLNKTYNTLLKHASGNSGKAMPDLKWLENVDGVISFVRTMTNIGTQKNYITSFIVALGANGESKALEDVYQTELCVLKTKLDELYADGKKTQKQMDNMVSWHTILKFREQLRKRVNCMMKLKNNDKTQVTKQDIMEYQEFVCLCLYTYLRPSRNDYHDTLMISNAEYNALSDEDKDNHNYMVLKNRSKAFYHRADFKTRKSHGVDIVDIPRPLLKVLWRWFEVSGQNHLLINKDGSVMNSSGLTRFLTNLFLKHINKRISSTLLRQIYLTDKYSDSVRDLRKDTLSMNNSIKVALRHYIKMD